jgi:hypothetical protein
MNLSPQRANYSADSTGDRIKKSPRWDDDQGVAATVGTIMALLVFLTFFGLFTNQFVPVWMSDNESTHMSEAVAQFTTLKSSIDLSIANNANSRIAPTPVFVPITLSSTGIPVFAAATAGILYYVPEGLTTRPSFSLSYTYKSSNGVAAPLNPSTSNDVLSGGDLELYCPNRYFVEQRLIYENGAIILNQTDGEFIIAGPQLLIKDVGTPGNPSIVVLFTQVSLQGANVTIGGTGSKGVSANLLYADTKEFSNDAAPDLFINMTTQHGWAWYRYFNSTLTGAGMANSTDFEITSPVLHSFAERSLNYYTLSITIHHVTMLDHTKGTVKMVIGELGF